MATLFPPHPASQDYAVTRATGYYGRHPSPHGGSEILYNKRKSKPNIFIFGEKNKFTLIELLVVIAIIGILFGLVAPALNKVKQKANSTKCLNNLHNISLAFQGYLLSSGDIMPIASTMPSLNLNTDPRIVDVLSSELQNNTAVFQCPADNSPVDNGKTYFEAEGSSYEYMVNLGGRKIDRSTRPPATNPVMHDYICFHGIPTKPGAMNYILADWHVGDLE
ncbi:MAG TPA: hypothetical protein DCZ94_09855 [Lentisphaeria bacterium]|nr:hypothetical protein [Lentisphaeria bacterium]